MSRTTAAIYLARSTLTDLIHRTGDLLEPIYQALLTSVLHSLVIAMDETPIKAGVQSQGKMNKRGPWRDVDAVEYETLRWVDCFNTRRLLEPLGDLLLLSNSRTGFMITAALRRQHHDADKLGSEEPGAVQKAFTRSRNDISTQTATRYLQTTGQ